MSTAKYQEESFHFSFSPSCGWFYSRRLGYLVPSFKAVLGMDSLLGMVFKLNQTLVGHSRKFCVTFDSVHLAGRTDCRLKVVWPGFYFGSLQNTFLPQRDWKVGEKAPCGHQFNLSTFSEQCGCCIQQQGPAVSFQKAALYLSISMGCLEISKGPPQPTNRPNVTPDHQWKPCLATKIDNPNSVSSIISSPH